MHRLCGEEGQVAAWILRIFVVAAVIGIIISQCGPIIWNHLSIGPTAEDAADTAAQSFMKYHLHPENPTEEGLEKVTEDVEKWLDERDARLAANINVFQKDGRSYISVTVRKIVNTTLFKNVSYLSRYTEASAYREKELIQ